MFPKDLQDILIEAQKEAEDEHAAKVLNIQPKLDQKLKDAGVKFIKFSSADANKYLDTIYSGFCDRLARNN